MEFYFFTYYLGVVCFFTNLFSKDVMDIITFIGSILSFVATIIIAVVQYKQGKRMEDQGTRMEDLTIKQDEAQRKERAQRIKAERDSFIMKYHNDEHEIYMLPLCWIASIYDPAYAYRRKMYMEYNMLEEDVQDAICKYMKFNVPKPHNERDDFYSDCVNALKREEEKNYVSPHNPTLFYDDAKYIRIAFEKYGMKKAPPKMSLDWEYKWNELIEEYQSNPYNMPNPIRQFLEYTKYDQATCGLTDEPLCTIQTYIAYRMAYAYYDPSSIEAEGYWVPGGYSYERLSTLEDYFLCVLFCIYLFLIRPQQKGTNDDKT